MPVIIYVSNKDMKKKNNMILSGVNQRIFVTFSKIRYLFAFWLEDNANSIFRPQFRNILH